MSRPREIWLEHIWAALVLHGDDGLSWEDAAYRLGCSGGPTLRRAVQRYTNQGVGYPSLVENGGQIHGELARILGPKWGGV